MVNLRRKYDSGEVLHDTVCEKLGKRISLTEILLSKEERKSESFRSRLSVRGSQTIFANKNLVSEERRDTVRGDFSREERNFGTHDVFYKPHVITGE